MGIRLVVLVAALAGTLDGKHGGPMAPSLASGPVRFGFANIAGDYRLDPTVNLLTEGGNQAVALGVATQFVFIDTSPQSYPGGSAPGETFTVGPNQPPAVQVQDPVFDRYLRRPEIPLVVALALPGVGPIPPGYRTPTTDAFYQPERDRMFNLTRQLYQQFNGTGKTFILKNWEGDWYLMDLQSQGNRHCNNPLLPDGNPDRTYDADVVCAKNLIRYFRARQRGVAEARAQFGASSNVAVYHAVEVNHVADALQDRLRLTHLLPYIGSDLVAYSAWDSLDGGTYSRVRSDLNAALDLLMSQPQQLAMTTTGRFAGQFAEFPVRSPDPLGLQSRRIAITEFGIAQNRPENPPSIVDLRIRAVVDVSRARNIIGAYYWQLYDNECQGAQCPGFMLYRPNGTSTVALQKLQQYAGWGTGGGPPAPTNLRVDPPHPVSGETANLVWNASPGATQYLVGLTLPSGAQTTATTPNPWYTLGTNSEPGDYAWTLRASGPDGQSPTVAGPGFGMIAGGPRNAAFVSQNVPGSLLRNQTATVSVTMRNNGFATWSRLVGYRLGSQNPQDNVTWGLGRVELPPGQEVERNETTTFTFTIRAPATPGPREFQWQMLREGVAWFGAPTTSVTIQVQ